MFLTVTMLGCSGNNSSETDSTTDTSEIDKISDDAQQTADELEQETDQLENDVDSLLTDI